MLSGADQCPAVESLLALIEAWRGADSATLQQIFLRKDPGIPAIVAFALASLGGEANLDFLIEQILVPELPDDTHVGNRRCTAAFQSRGCQPARDWADAGKAGIASDRGVYYRQAAGGRSGR